MSRSFLRVGDQYNQGCEQRPLREVYIWRMKTQKLCTLYVYGEGRFYDAGACPLTRLVIVLVKKAKRRGSTPLVASSVWVEESMSPINNLKTRAEGTAGVGMGMEGRQACRGGRETCLLWGRDRVELLVCNMLHTGTLISHMVATDVCCTCTYHDTYFK